MCSIEIIACIYHCCRHWFVWEDSRHEVERGTHDELEKGSGEASLH